MSSSPTRALLVVGRMIYPLTAVWLSCACLYGGPLIPGTGVQKNQVGDDFEDPEWKYVTNLPKSSREQDERERRPFAYSTNGRWVEGPHRGTPDLLRRVAVPEGGLAGSEAALLIRTMRSGVPGRLSYRAEQDDLIVNTTRRLGGFLSVSRSPSVVTRVYVPPFDQWENRTGASFGFRADVRGRKGRGPLEQYWPGFFIQFRSQGNRGYKEDAAYLTIRARQSGHDVPGPEITPGWWTLGMSFTPDGQVHFFASPGVDDLTSEDHLASYYCYGFRAERFYTFFYNILSRDDGRTWSTPWVIDDPSLYSIPRNTQPLAQRRTQSRR